MTAIIITVPDIAAGARLDKWLAEALPGVSRSRLKALIEDGAVTVADKIVRAAAHRIKAGQRIHVVVPTAVDAVPRPQTMTLDIVFEDDHLIVVNKPPGLVVHPAAGNPDKTLVNALLAHCGGSLVGIGGVKRPGIVHRIDKDTSGLLVVAKTEAAHAGLSAQFAAHDLERTYDALVWGLPRPAKGRIVGAIGRSTSNRKKMAIVMRGGKHAETHYETTETFGDIAAHVRCSLKTGRTHQIRVHMAGRGHALIGDPVYGGGKTKSLRGLPPDVAGVLKGFPRQALHAATLGFKHPVTGKALRFERKPPGDFQDLRKALAKI